LGPSIDPLEGGIANVAAIFSRRVRLAVAIFATHLCREGEIEPPTAGGSPITGAQCAALKPFSTHHYPRDIECLENFIQLIQAIYHSTSSSFAVLPFSVSSVNLIEFNVIHFVMKAVVCPVTLLHIHMPFKLLASLQLLGPK
jgi:hypothetical protein